jgi:predicted dehydrogenase
MPALREVGSGDAEVIGSRDTARARSFAASHGIARGVGGYQSVLNHPGVDAVYVALPNSLHAEWTIAALRAGLSVLCEKPLCVSVPETELVLKEAAGALLWEAFVFLFHEQTHRVQDLISQGAIGEPREILSSFHFPLDRQDDIRLSRELAGGALRDVGCYPIRLARLIFEADPQTAWATAAYGDSGVDVELAGALHFSGDRRLLMTCGFRRPLDTFTRIIGDRAELRLTNPFNPIHGDTVELVSQAGHALESPTEHRHPFAPALDHIHRTIRGQESAQHLAVAEARGNAQAIDWLEASAAASVNHA